MPYQLQVLSGEIIIVFNGMLSYQQWTLQFISTVRSRVAGFTQSQPLSYCRQRQVMIVSASGLDYLLLLLLNSLSTQLNIAVNSVKKMLVRLIQHCSKNSEVFPINVFDNDWRWRCRFMWPLTERVPLHSLLKTIPTSGFCHHLCYRYAFLFAGVACDIDNADEDLLDRLCGQINGEFTLKTLVRGELL